MFRKPDELRAVASSNEAREGLAELMGAQLPGTPFVEWHADVVRKGVKAKTKLHTREADDPAATSALDEEKIAASRLISESLIQLLGELNRAYHGGRSDPALDPPRRIGDRLEQARDDIGLLDASLTGDSPFYSPCFHRQNLAHPHADETRDHDDASLHQAPYGGSDRRAAAQWQAQGINECGVLERAANTVVHRVAMFRAGRSRVYAMTQHLSRDYRSAMFLNPGQRLGKQVCRDRVRNERDRPPGCARAARCFMR